MITFIIAFIVMVCAAYIGSAIIHWFGAADRAAKRLADDAILSEWRANKNENIDKSTWVLEKTSWSHYSQ